MRTLQDEIKYFEQNESKLKAKHNHKWVVISNQTILGFFDNYQLASDCLCKHFNPKAPDTPFLVRQIGMAEPVMPHWRFATA